ncbi:dimethyladenosine transferase [Prauserella muralis]|uniref:Dimethyladenosine transferase n=1 Tax=Prauserella muralis TaxID=588067 RepID=A0A2V4AXU1_9PSEU|nr:dimethyladenosine transferase [Prauserella muralis]
MHFLVSRPVVRQLIRSCAPGPGDLVVELGAGAGAITVPLAATGARVIAVERDPAFTGRLRTRLADAGNVRVVDGDARTIALPRKPFLVVASIPYSISTVLLRRLLDPRATALRRAALVVEWGFARRLTAAVPRSAELAWWAARFDLRLVRRVAARCFQPAPTVDSAHLLIERRPGLGGQAGQLLRALLDAAYGDPHRPVLRVVARVTGYRPRRPLARCGIDPVALAGTVTARQWAALAVELTRSGNSQPDAG